MKTRFLNLICLVACIATGTILSLAQDGVTVLNGCRTNTNMSHRILNTSLDMSQYQKVHAENGIEQYVKKDVIQRANKKDEGDFHNVTFVFNLPDGMTNGRPDADILNIYLYNKNEIVWVDPWMMMDGRIEDNYINEGTYQFYMELTLNREAPTSKGCSVGIITKENILINKDTTITIDFADAKNVIYMEKKLPNGEAFADGDMDYRTNEYINTPNVTSVGGDLLILDKDRGCLSTFILSHPEANYIDENGVTHDERFKVLTSDLSDRYTMVHEHIALGLDSEQNNYYTVFAAKTGINTSENIPCNGKYTTISSRVQPSVLAKSSTTWRGPRAEYLFLNENDGFLCESNAGINTGKFNEQYTMNVCESVKELPNGYKAYYGTSLDEYMYEETSSKEAIIIPWGDISGNEIKYQVIPARTFDYNLTPDGARHLKSSSIFSFKASEATDKFGNSTPINIFGYNSTQMGMKIHNPTCYYVGRMGETRQTDNCSLTFDMLYNGENVCKDYQKVQDWIYSEEHPDGVYDVTLVNKNMMVDDMQGCNTTKVHYDTRNEDFTPPTVMMLQFRNTEDNSVTDRFENGDKAAMYLAAKDYTLGLNENWAMAMECRPVNVKVSYAANGMDEWTELDINEMPELFDEYAFGYIYGTTLDQVNCTSENKWFDLKIEVSDEAGNWQEQVVSPAFRINDAPTGITGVKVGNATEVCRYTVDGRAISTPQSGVNIIKMSDGSVKKVWVK